MANEITKENAPYFVAAIAARKRGDDVTEVEEYDYLISTDIIEPVVEGEWAALLLAAENLLSK